MMAPWKSAAPGPGGVKTSGGRWGSGVESIQNVVSIQTLKVERRIKVSL